MFCPPRRSEPSLKDWLTRDRSDIGARCKGRKKLGFSLMEGYNANGETRLGGRSDSFETHAGFIRYIKVNRFENKSRRRMLAGTKADGG